MNNFFNRYIIGAYVTVIVSILGFFVDVSSVNVNYISDTIFYTITGVAGLYTLIISIFFKKKVNNVVNNIDLMNDMEDIGSLNRLQTDITNENNTFKSITLQIKDVQIVIST